MKFIRAIFGGMILSNIVRIANASSVLPLTLDEHVQASDAIFRGTVLKVVSYKNSDGLIFTRTSLRVDEVFKGRFPPVVNVVHHGGEVDGIGQVEDLSPQFRVGEERLLFVTRRSDGTLYATQGDSSAMKLQRDGNRALSPAQQYFLDRVRVKAGSGKGRGADVTGQGANIPNDGFVSAPSGDNGGTSTNGLLMDGSGVPWRYPAPDRSEAISYLVDTNALPATITPAQALGAVSNAFAAWAGASSFKFVFAGTQNFGTASPTINTNDGIFRIQLHDDTNYITSPNVLGVGGSYFTAGLLPGANWGPGGNVAGMEFNNGLCGYVILKHTNSAMQNLSTFTEVLTHEIGHVIGLAHSSNITTNDPVLTNSVMYFTVHADGRGAKLNSYDTNVVRELHPLNTPPYSYPRVMDITTSPFGSPNVAGINSIELRGYDLQSTNLTFAVTNIDLFAGGSFSVVGNLIKFTQPGYTGGARSDPAGSGYYDLLCTRFSDGTNASPYVTVRTISFNPDSDSPASDGIPDAWMASYFGHMAPQSADKSRAADDKDGDGLNNLQEYIAGSIPTNAAYAQRATIVSPGTIRWQAKAYELYEIQSITNLASTNWTRFGNPVVPTSASLQVRTNLLAAPITATVSNLPMTNARMFFRIQKVP